MTRVKVIDGDELKTGDTEPNLSVELVKNNGVSQVLSTADDTVHFRMREAGGDELIVDDDTSGNVEIAEEDQGRVVYSWQSGDTGTPATYECEVEVNFGTGGTITFPNSGFFNVLIEAGLE